MKKINIVLIIGVIILIGKCSSWTDEATEKRNADKTEVVANPKEVREARIKKHFSGWDGSHRGLVKSVKAYMKNPNSFDHVGTGWVDKGDNIYVEMTYRGTNSFGGVVTQTAYALININGAIIEWGNK